MAEAEVGYYDRATNTYSAVPVPPTGDVRGHRGRGRIIDDEDLDKMLRRGKTQADIARHFGVSRAAVSQRVSDLKHRLVKEAAGVAPQIIAREIRTADQLCKINQTANALLDSLYTMEEAVDPISGKSEQRMALKDPNLALRTMGEIRAQLKFQLEIFQALTDVKAVKEFQDTVLETINSVAPEVRDAVVKALQRKNALRSALEFH